MDKDIGELIVEDTGWKPREAAIVGVKLWVRQIKFRVDPMPADVLERVIRCLKEDSPGKTAVKGTPNFNMSGGWRFFTTTGMS